MDKIEFTIPDSVAEAVSVQSALREKVRLEDDFLQPKTIAGIDVSYDVKTDTSYAFIVLMGLHDLRVLEAVRAEAPTPFPYVPGLLSFREIPVVLKALEQLRQLPDILMVDGQGVAHPRRLGIAAHLGVILDMPALGVAKSRLLGRYNELEMVKGSVSPLMDGAERIGTVLRSRDKVNPLFVSPGHRMGHASAVRFCMQCLTRYRLPEPTRIADKLSKTQKYTLSLMVAEG